MRLGTVAPRLFAAGPGPSTEDWAGGHPPPQLGDFVVLKVKDGSEEPGVAFAGVFDESWKLP